MSNHDSTPRRVVKSQKAEALLPAFDIGRKVTLSVSHLDSIRCRISQDDKAMTAKEALCVKKC